MVPRIFFKSMGDFLWLRRAKAGCSPYPAGHSIDLGHVAAQPIGALPAYANLVEIQPRCGSSKACLPLNGSYHKVSTVAPFLLDCSGLLPIPGHLIGISVKRRRGSGIRLLVPEKHSLCL